ncbi:hypothetical protein BDV32DRAFT_128196 [Aspergillus pseudonomiae]|nr:hypothetical protein BDV32DRAFT_128196 [Aspergillus pseudonomiae]
MLTRSMQISLAQFLFFIFFFMSKVFWFRAGTKSRGRSKWIHPERKKILGDPESVSGR